MCQRNDAGASQTTVSDSCSDASPGSLLTDPLRLNAGGRPSFENACASREGPLGGGRENPLDEPKIPIVSGFLQSYTNPQFGERSPGRMSLR